MVCWMYDIPFLKNREDGSYVAVFYSQFVVPICNFSVLFCIILILKITPAYAETAVLSNPVVADVTDRSFSLIWTTDQAGEFHVELFSDAAGSSQLTEFKVSSYGVKDGSSLFPEQNQVANKQALENGLNAKGIAKVVVTGLLADTTYYIKFGVSDSVLLETTMCPDSGVLYCIDQATALMLVRTENRSNREASGKNIFINDVVLHLDNSAEQGDLIIVSLENANYPVSALVGDSVPARHAFIDLNNYFDSNTNESALVINHVETDQGFANQALSIVKYSGLNGTSQQLAVLDTIQQTGVITGALKRHIGDCNADNSINGYDNLLLANYVSGVFLGLEDTEISFHKFLCNLYAEEGKNHKYGSVVVNALDLALHNDLVVGKQNIESLPVVP